MTWELIGEKNKTKPRNVIVWKKKKNHLVSQMKKKISHIKKQIKEFRKIILTELRVLQDLKSLTRERKLFQSDRK